MRENPGTQQSGGSSERSQRELQLQTLNRTLQALTHINQAMLRTTEEAALLQEVCRIIVEDCGHRMAWVGFAENDEHKSVVPVAIAGFEDGYLETLRISWADNANGHGPVGTAIRTGAPCSFRNILEDPKFVLWREQARKRGYASVLALPFPREGRPPGVVAIYAKDRDAFAEAEVKLLSELAANLGYGIGALRARAARERSEEALRQNQEWLRVTLTSIGDAVVATNMDGRITFLNPVAAELTGWSSEEAHGQPTRDVFRIINELTREGAEDIVARVLREGHVVGLANHTSLIAKDGREVPIEDSAAPILDRNGKVVGVVLVFHDITAKRRAQDALLESRTKLESALASMSDAVFIADPEGRFHDFNDAFVRFYRFKSKAECATKLYDYPNFLEVFGDNGELVPVENWVASRALRGESATNSEHSLRRKDTGETWVGSYSYAPIRGKDGTIAGAVVTARDITELKASEKALRASEERLRLLGDNLPNSMVYQYTFDADGTPRFLYVSAGVEKLNGVKAEDVLKDAGVILRQFLPEDVPALLEAEKVSARDLTVFEREIRMRLPDGQIRWMYFRSRPRRLENGQIVWDGVQTDITERKRAEDALLRSEKLASVGRMAAAIAHEMNNPLAAVTNVLFLAMHTQDLPDSARRYLRIAEEELKRIAHITRQSLGFYRESNAPAIVSVGAVLDSTVDLLKSRIKAKGAVIEKQLRRDVEIKANAGELRQVFSNLLANSLDAICEKGTIKLRVSSGAAFSNGRRCVRVTIADNGKGIAESARQQLFEPFFTTKGTVGTGLGLWVSKQIVDKHGGHIRVRSHNTGANTGTVFSVVLPVEYAAAARSGEMIAATATETLLIR